MHSAQRALKSQSKAITKSILIVVKDISRHVQPFMLVTIWQPIGGFKHCCCCDWT